MSDEPSGLVQGARDLYSGFTRVMDKMPPKSAPRKVDDTHARMVREANESFRKSARSKRKSTKRK